MKTIYCFMENQDLPLEEFIQKHDADSEIHLYSSVIESCEKNMFFCLGEMLSVFWEYDDRLWIVTDVREVFFYANELFVPLFDRIVFVDQGIDRGFTQKLDIGELLDYSSKTVPLEYQQIVSALVSLHEETDLIRLYELSEKIRKQVQKENWKFSSFLGYFCRLILFMEQQGELAMTEEARLFVMSLLMKVEYLSVNTNRYLEYILQSERYHGDNYYFIWNQFKNIRLRSLAAEDEYTTKLLNEFYDKSYCFFYAGSKDDLVRIPKSERNKNRVVILTIQLLGKGHAPTRTVLERCKALKKLGKEVYLINTAEQYTTKGYIPMYDATGGTVIRELESKRQQDMDDGEVIWFRQLPDVLPIVERLSMLISLLLQIKPYYILSIGSGSMLADLAGNMVPCASMGLSSSTLPHTMNKMKILGRRQREEEKCERIRDDIIESRFTCELKPQKGHFCRSQFKFPEEEFLLVVVGIRLDYELSEEFLGMLEYVCGNGCYVVFAGIYDSYGKMLKRHTGLEEKSVFMGYCQDIMALMEICDLYVNPRRLGGGTSIIEAFAMGRPGVYLPSGDVYAVGGEEFSVRNYEEMADMILKYKGNRTFYQERSHMAKERAKFMTSSVDAMRDLDDSICSRVEAGYW